MTRSDRLAANSPHTVGARLARALDRGAPHGPGAAEAKRDAWQGSWPTCGIESVSPIRGHGHPPLPRRHMPNDGGRSASSSDAGGDHSVWHRAGLAATRCAFDHTLGHATNHTLALVDRHAEGAVLALCSSALRPPKQTRPAPAPVHQFSEWALDMPCGPHRRDRLRRHIGPSGWAGTCDLLGGRCLDHRRYHLEVAIPRRKSCCYIRKGKPEMTQRPVDTRSRLVVTVGGSPMTSRGPQRQLS